MAFLSPLFLIGAAAAAIPIVLHMLKREPEARVRFAAVKLLKDAPVEHAEKKHLRELFLLALRMAALFLLAIAFARPFFGSGDAAASAGVTIVALDRSYSMSAPGRFERAQQAAREAIAKAPTSDLVGVVAFDDVAEVLAKPSGDRVLANAAIGDAAPGFGATRYRAALSASAQLLDGRRGSIVVVTDLQEAGWVAGDQAAVPETATIAIADVGPVPDNLAVIAVEQAGDRLLASVRNAGATPRDAHVRLTVDDQPAGDSTVTLAPNAIADVTFTLTGRPSAAAVAVDDADGLQADNVRYAVLGGAGRAKLLVVTSSGDLDREAYYVKAALEAAAPGAGSYETEGIGAAELGSRSAEQLAAHPAVVILSTRGLDRRGRELLTAYARAGGGLLIAAGPDVDGDVLGSGTPLQIASVEGARPERRTLAPADVRHPIFQRFAANTASLGLVEFRQVATVSGADCRQLARFTTGETALIDCVSGEGRLLVLASDLDNRWNDFPLHATFVPFLHEAVGYLAVVHSHAAEYVIGDASAGGVRQPGFVDRPVAAQAGGSAPARIAVNIDPRESDPARISTEDFQGAIARLKDAGAPGPRVAGSDQEDSQHLWQYVLGMMVIVLIAEGAVASRTA